MITGIVDVGGGLRGIYAAGILDYCMVHKIQFDCCIGVSAGSANMAAYLAGQQGRNYIYYQEYSFRREYMGTRNLIQSGSYIDLNYVYGTLSNADGEYPLDYYALSHNPAKLFVVATQAETGQACYFTKEDMHPDDFRILMASCCVPGVNRPYEWNGVKYYDGALSDPVPIEKAFAEGCDRVVLILTKPVTVPRKQGKDRLLASLIQWDYPIAAQQLRMRAERYNRAVQMAKEYEAAGRMMILSPDDITGVDTLKRNRPALQRLYYKGLQDGKRVLGWISQHENKGCEIG